MSPPRYSIALGGIGGDAHSVGLTVLRRALTGASYRLHHMGTQNSLSDFFSVAGHVDVVMISCLDGHLRHYLAEFADLRAAAPGGGALWYAGGNLAVDHPERVRAEVLGLGFRRVFPGYVGIPEVLATLVEDLSGRAPNRAFPPPPPRRPVSVVEPPPDERVPAVAFHRERREVLGTWRTGWQARSLDDNARFLLRQPSFAGRQAASGTPLVQPRSGVALVEDQLAAFRALRRAGADVLSYQVDSLTRNNAYESAADGIAGSRDTGTSTLNGFPMVNHGVEPLRRISAELTVPLQTRHSTRDPRLLAEISCAGGVTGFEGGAISYDVPYFKDHPLALSLRRWQYVDRLVGGYADKYGVVIDREFFGTLTAVLVPPCLAIVVNLVEAVLAVRQGVRSVSLGYAEQGNRSQDVAAVRVLRELGRKYLANLGHPDVRVNTVFHQYMAAFPDDAARASQLITASAQTARLADATRLMVKTPVEATAIPSPRDNEEGMRLCRRGIGAAARIALDEHAVAKEAAVLRVEVEQIFESIVVCGGGSLPDGVVRAFTKGYLDIPFAPSGENRGDVVTVRDARGAVRFLDAGNLQLSDEVLRFHRQKAEERVRAEAEPFQGAWEIVARDVLQVPEGRYRGWPLDGG
ncbi:MULTISPECIES: methylaspartate mutase subunit E [Actinosynnema]|uniref:methylaspartate mutase subunit E n=1 Tax=Actinosynnema TaxID=40566 RepID=UPI0020A267C4|nr:methylaspartate mutase subunit E [Actinosynnema pretiosum]MCP2097818.1 Glutamate mutase subunit E [Actinosynnema pretiosum]